MIMARQSTTGRNFVATNPSVCACGNDEVKTRLVEFGGSGQAVQYYCPTCYGLKGWRSLDLRVPEDAQYAKEITHENN
ncbi:MAG: hypothetical protein DRH97_02950 [Chloroflexi bacterium]|nr:MAG: hypothetical protein DRH97_02950 [Chloroflexota bacterium]